MPPRILVAFATAWIVLGAQTDDEQAVRVRLEALRQAEVAGDTKTIGELQDIDFHDRNQEGLTYTATERLTLYKSFQPKEVVYENLEVRVVGPAALVTGIKRETSRRGGIQTLLITQMWTKRSEGWKVSVIYQSHDPAAGHRIPQGWIGPNIGAGIVAGLDTEVKRSGKSSAFMSTTYRPGTPNGALYQRLDAKVYEGKRVRLTGYARGHMEGSSGAFMSCLDADRFTAVETSSHDISYTLSPDWNEFSLVLDVPAGATALTFGFWITGHGQVWLDDWKLEIVGKDVPSTERSQTEQDRLQTDRTRAARKDFRTKYPESAALSDLQYRRQTGGPRAEPTNLDFETRGQ